MELLDVLDENGNVTGVSEERNVVHDKGLWHYHVGIWLINKKGEVLLQKRSHNKKRNPDKWDRTGGHVNAGESPLQGIIRETKEELGIELDEKDISLFGIDREEILNEPGIINRNFVYTYITIVDYKVSDYVLQKEELSEVKYMTIEDMIEERNNGNKDYTFCNWSEHDFNRHIKWLKEGRERI